MDKVSVPTLLIILMLGFAAMHVTTMILFMYQEHILRFMDFMTEEELYAELNRRRMSSRGGAMRGKALEPRHIMPVSPHDEEDFEERIVTHTTHTPIIPEMSMTSTPSQASGPAQMLQRSIMQATARHTDARHTGARPEARMPVTHVVDNPSVFRGFEPMPTMDPMSIQMTPVDAYQQSIASIEGQALEAYEGSGKAFPAYNTSNNSSAMPQDLRQMPMCKNFNTFNF